MLCLFADFVVVWHFSISIYTALHGLHCELRFLNSRFLNGKIEKQFPLPSADDENKQNRRGQSPPTQQSGDQDGDETMSRAGMWLMLAACAGVMVSMAAGDSQERVQGAFVHVHKDFEVFEGQVGKEMVFSVEIHNMGEG